MSLSEFKQKTRVAGLLVFLLISPMALALDQNQAKPILADLHALMSHSYQTINAYYTFSMSPGDKVLYANALTKIDELDSMMANLEAKDGAVEVQGELATITEFKLKFVELLKININDVINLGYPDLRLSADMAQQNLELVNAAQKAFVRALDLAGIQQKPEVKLLREAQLLLERMLTNYSARSASNVSQIFQGAEGEKAPDELAVEFDKLLERLTNSKLNTGENADTIDKMSTQWNFIRNSYINYAEDNASYVVNLYSLRISEGLSKLLKKETS